MAHYLIFGDSITQGFNDLTGGWVQRLRESLTLDDFVINLGVSGDTSDGLLARFEVELNPIINRRRIKYNFNCHWFQRFSLE